MDEDVYLIIPGCDDTNRGDQALIWETIDIAKEAGYIGNFCILADHDKIIQSRQKGIRNVEYVLKHPSTYFKNTKNVRYTPFLKIKWAAVSIVDFLRMELLIYPALRKILSKFYSKQVQESLNTFSKAKAAFVKGGGFLHAYGGLIETYKIYYFLYHIRLALSFGINVFVMPNSFGPFASPFVKSMLRKVLSQCQVVMSREDVSQKQLHEECGISSYLFPDIAFYLHPDENYDAVSSLVHHGIPINKRKCVALTMRPYRFPGETDKEGKYIKYKSSLAGFIEWLTQNDFYPVLVEHVSSVQDHEDDMSCISEVAQLIPAGYEYSIFSDVNLTSEQMKRIYGCFDYIVGTRFHSVIFSLSSGVPAIAISYGGNKGTGIMKDLGLNNYCIPISEVTEERLITLFLRLVQNEMQVKEQIRLKLEHIEKQKVQIVDLIRK